MTNKNRVLVIGLDGATWDVLNPLIKEGYLPNLKKLKESGVSSILKSNFPPVTGSAWMSIATGKSPGETGIFDFLVLEDRKTWKLRPISSEDYRRNGAIWDYLSAKGLKVGIVNYPMLYPPYPINGVMISGLGAPEDGDIFYPPELKEKLKKAIGKHRIYVPFARPKYANPKYFIRDIEELINYNYRLADYLIDDTYDFFIFVISASDFLGHYGWHWWEDKNHKYHKTFKELWHKIDEIVGLMVEKWGDGYVVVISDHGMGRLKEIFLINKWLQQEGFLVLRSGNNKLSHIKRNIKVLLKKIFDAITQFCPILGDYIFCKFIKKITKNRYISQEIDFIKSKAFALDHCGLGNIYINTVDKKEREYIKNMIKSKLISFLNNIGKSIEIYLKEEIYKGQFLDNLPDLVFMIDSNLVEVNHSIKEKIIRKPLARNKTGSHRIEGILIISGNIINTNFKEFDFHDYVNLAKIPQIIYTLINEISFQNKTENESYTYKCLKEKEKIRKKLEDLGYL